jgi:hypothetical protein
MPFRFPLLWWSCNKSNPAPKQWCSNLTKKSKSIAREAERSAAHLAADAQEERCWGQPGPNWIRVTTVTRGIPKVVVQLRSSCASPCLGFRRRRTTTEERRSWGAGLPSATSTCRTSASSLRGLGGAPPSASTMLCTGAEP